MLSIKPGVRLTGASSELVIGINVVHSVHVARGIAMTITSVTDGRHSSGSLHHCGRAFDCRTRHLTADEANALAHDVVDALGPEWDVVLESTHLHVEHDPD